MTAGPWAPAAAARRVTVVGSVNVDLVARTDVRPVGGETVVATGYHRTSGGKGANQAAAAARAGAGVLLVAAVGDDEAGGEQVRDLARRGVDTGAVAVLAGVPTSFAMIVVTPDGENSIVVVPGANARLAAAHVDAGGRDAGVLVLQSEVPAAVLDHAAAHVTARRVVLNNGPWVALAPATLHRADPLVVNRSEAVQACGLPGAAVPPEGLAPAVRRATGARSVVVTLGADGVSVSGPGGDAWRPAVAAPAVVDTTGAGDTFVGALAAGLARGEGLDGAVLVAVRAAAEAVTWPGARPPLPATGGTGPDPSC